MSLPIRQQRWALLIKFMKHVASREAYLLADAQVYDFVMIACEDALYV